MKFGFTGVAAALALAACAPAARPELPKAPVPAGSSIRIQAAPVPLNTADPAQDRLGNFAYAGGLQLTSDQTSRLHGLSDLKVWPDGRVLSISDEGDLLEARLALDPQGRPIGLTDAHLKNLVAEDGKPFASKLEADAEGVDELPNGDLLVSFESHDRALLYPAAGGPPKVVPSPPEKFPFNSGMEALALLPAAGSDAYVTGGEVSGQTWVCRLSAGCTEARKVDKPAEFGLTAVAPLPGGRIAYLLRAYDPLRGARGSLRIEDGQGNRIDQVDLARPFTVDNYEGLAAVPRPDGTIRFYIISDDNFSSSQRTLLLAFDWRPPTGR